MSKLWKLTPVIALSLAVVLLVAGVLIAVYAEQSYKAQKIDEVRVQAQILSSSVTAALVFNDHPAVQEYVNALKANPEIRAVAVYGARGAIAARVSRPGAPPPPETVLVRPPHFVGDRLVVVTPVMQDDGLVGTVYLRTLVEPFAVRLARNGGIVLLITMASLVVAVLGVAHAALTKANTELKNQALDLAEANKKLHAQIEEREKAEEALRQSQKMEAIGQLSGGIAHDFNNLLTVVGGNLQLLQKRLAQGRTDVARYVDRAMDGLNRATGLTQRILAFSRRQPLSPKPVDLSRLIVETGELLRHSLPAMITVETRLEADWWTLCDQNQMENLVLNLVINARDAMPEGGRLIIETAKVRVEASSIPFGGVLPGSYVRLSVIDSGIGMSPEVQRKAIDPFFTTKPPGQGTGLGLSMIFGYVKQSDGYLHIESAPGKGTNVTILMPRYLGGEIAEESGPHAASAARPSSEARAAPADAPTVMVVEDEAGVRMLTVGTLRDEGYKVIEAAEGTEALRMLQGEAKIDLLVSDVKLPGVSGYQLAASGIARRPGLKVLLMTGYAQEPVPDELARAGVTILYKPFDLEKLASWAARMLKERINR